MKVADEEEAIRLANDSIYGLSATVWTGDKERGERIARRLDVGAVNINDVISNAFAYDIPMGGWKHSGVGTRLGGAGRSTQILPATSYHVAAHTDASQGAALVSGVAAAHQVRAGPVARVRGARRAPVRSEAKVVRQCCLPPTTVWPILSVGDDVGAQVPLSMRV